MLCASGSGSVSSLLGPKCLPLNPVHVLGALLPPWGSHLLCERVLLSRLRCDCPIPLLGSWCSAEMQKLSSVGQKWAQGPEDHRLRSTLHFIPWTLCIYPKEMEWCHPVPFFHHCDEIVKVYFGSLVQRFWFLVRWLYYSGFEMKKNLETAGKSRIGSG